MKTKKFIITALLVCTFSLLYAGSPKTIIIKSSSLTIEIQMFDDNSFLAPETPGEATFEDSDPFPATGFNLLAPITPKEASFDDLASGAPVPSENLSILEDIKPETPETADFEETSGSRGKMEQDSPEVEQTAFSALK